jgi:glycosyltransferase
LIISVITVSFNSAKTIRQTIESVLGQTHKEIDYIVIDGGSTDGTLDIIREYDEQLRWVSEPDPGLYFAMNKGWAMAKGEFVGFLNADDLYYGNDVLYTYNKYMEVHSNFWFFYADLVYVDPIDTDKIVRYWKAGPYKRKAFLYGWMPPHPTFYVRKKCLEALGGFKTKDFRTAADYELMLRYCYKMGLDAYYIPKLMVRMRIGGVSNRSILHRLRANLEDYRAWRINEMWPMILTILLKPVRKINQYFMRPPKPKREKL